MERLYQLCSPFWLFAMAKRFLSLLSQRWILGVVFAKLFIFSYVIFSDQSKIVIKGGKVDCVWQQPNFVLKWRHSVEKQFWQEFYEQKDGQLHLTKTFMQTFGAGVPATGQTVSAPDGYVGLASDLYFPQLRWVVSRNMQGQIIGESGVWSIANDVPDYTEIEIQVENHSNWVWFFKEKCQ